MVLSLKSGGYWEPGVEMKLSAKLSTGECSYLIWGVVSISIDFESLAVWISLLSVGGRVWGGFCGVSLLGNLGGPQ
jgi:hypothetical protein